MWLILTLITLFLTTSFSQADVEIYSAGKYFKSIEDYKKKQQDESLHKLKINGPTVEKRMAPYISVLDLKKLDQMSFNQGINKEVEAFRKDSNSSAPRYVMDAKELEEVIRHAMEKRKEPSLVISNQGKIRIVSFHSKDQILSSSLLKNSENAVKQ